jgi:membrane protein YdbS with pleckstrin-like domain
MKPFAEPPDPAEPDLYWAGHSGWAMLPGFVLGVLASAAVMLSAPPIGKWVNMPPDWTAFLRFWLVLLGWIAAGIVWLYRGASFVYRLTPLRLYADFGMVYPPTPPIPLVEIVEIECRSWSLRRWFRVGSVIVRTQGRPPVRLRGIFRPDRFADAIRAAVRAAKGDSDDVKAIT